ncbi:chemotaxis protein CheD [Alteribacillus sp. HJP-4]|uniref:chemotaxis protein CheD n=1 Tax=Alteribacillus sp. HJP-4 TaxID=2775394 RepID=UPI0035CD2E61
MNKQMQKGQIVKVGMADWKSTAAPDTLRTSGLGSCIGVVVYEKRRKIAALAHIMLPDSSMARQKEWNRAKFADSALEDMFTYFQHLGLRSYQLTAKMAGGAQMFAASSHTSEMMRIGPRNAEAVKKILALHRVRLEGEDTGGSKGRTIEFDPEDSTLSIRIVHRGEKVL